MTISILFGLFGCGKKAEGEWQQLTISRSHMNAAQCFHFHVFPNDDGQMLLTGYCTDRDGTAYASETGTVLSEAAVRHLRGMKLDGLPNNKAPQFPAFAVSDGTAQKLTLTYANGKEKLKELSDELLDAVFALLLPELPRKITSVEQVNLHINGMRVTEEYVIEGGDPARISLYRFSYPDGEAVRNLVKRIFCSGETVLELLNSCGVLGWNGFYGRQPADVLDGDVFVLEASVNDGQAIRAKGSANYPTGYREFVRALNQLLSEIPAAD
ncbi:MAG: hypothetical protein E7654_01910 [Ruminococcaceae bacterium]|nr:hypothetical protein [Oscillospiraceae bacterium]